MTAHIAQTTLVEEAAAAAEGVVGVAFLRPGLAERLRSTLSRPAPHTGRARPTGVRMTANGDDGSWHVEIQVVVVRQARAVDVARAVRTRVRDRLSALTPTHPAPTVTVTVTGRV
ncbi:MULTISPECIES: Asp23/Gls24 family envelope stress response protein [unclassified Streptomyces]|uniref:Asp23/Gls24 family envelope stress response protein n=1 Tax=unclassified Streptomyces TaxID=2593676 RepID=UPI00190D9FB5|nr:Asp23/Gls24 family envelope stress response protein [Streptomyces sp. MBT33]MBK3644037.1 Asp23/Gls24 family envelope stress response protein [Streptomyces sp. MBT33]